VGKYCTVGQATDDNRTRRMRFACWIPKATGAQSLICITFRLVARTRLTVTLYVKCLSCCYHQKLYQHFSERLVFIKTLLGLHHNAHEYSQLWNPSPFHFWSLLYFWPQPKGLWHFHTTRDVI